MTVLGSLNRNLNIDSLRGIAVSGVLIYHSFPEMLPGGWLGVDVFFVISGFLMAHLLNQNVDIREFLLRRFVRLISPVFILISVFSIILIFLTKSSVNLPIDFSELIYSSLFLSNIYYFFNTDYFSSPDSPLIHFWSLGVEAQYYILIAFISLIHRSVYTYVLLIILGVIFEYLVRFGFTGYYLGVSEQALINETTVNSFLFYMVPARLWEFGTGGLVFYLSKKISVNSQPYWVLLALVYILLFYLATDFTLLDRLLAVFITGILLLSNKCPDFAKPLWCNPPK